MNILETRIYRGPNLYSLDHKVIRVTIDMENDARPDAAPGPDVLTGRLYALIPSLWEQRCCPGVPDLRAIQAEGGARLAQILQAVTMELQHLTGAPVTFGETRETSAPGVFQVVFEYQEEHIGQAAFDLAYRVVASLIPRAEEPGERPDAFDFQAELEALTRQASDLYLGPSTHSLVQAAEKRGIPWMRLNEESLVQLGYGKYQKRIQATITSGTSQIATEIASDKRLTNRLLDEAGIPVAHQWRVTTEDEAVDAAERLGYPVVVKPLDLNHGRGASLNLTDAEQVREGYRVAAAAGGKAVLVENYLRGSDYRILVVNDRVIAVAQRIPGRVVGDGVHTIQQLVDLVNSDPRRGLDHEKVLTRIVIDEQARRLVEQAGLTLETVLPTGQVLYLRATANMSTGGTAIDRTDEIHYENAEIARRAARIIGLDVAGIDLITPDISRSIREVGGGIIEVNAAPGFRMHIAPTEGKPRDAAGPVIDMLFPPGSPSRIPIAAVTGTNGKTTTTFMVGHILKMAGRCVGLTSTGGIYIDGEPYLKGDLTGPWSARMVLRDSKIDAAVLETARGGILREGLGFDRCDVGAVLNVTADHLGLYGIDTVEQMAQVKAMLVRVVAADGWAVLNADDPITAGMAAQTPGRVVYFCMSGRSKLVKEHVGLGGRAVVLEKGLTGQMITLYDNHQQFPITWAHLIPATLEGAARFNIANAMAAAAVTYCMGVSVEDIRQGLQTFTTTFNQVPGRLNIFEAPAFRVLIDYAHNPAAMKAMAELIHALRRPYNIGVIEAPGDRRDEDITELGHIAGGMFDELVIKETNLRGRSPGETSALLRRGAIAGGLPKDKIHIVLEELEAAAFALKRARPSALVVIFADDLDGTWDLVSRWDYTRECPTPRADSDKLAGPEKVESAESREWERRMMG